MLTKKNSFVPDTSILCVRNHDYNIDVYNAQVRRFHSADTIEVHSLQHRVRLEYTVSLWAGSAALIFNVYVRVYENISFLELTRPFCEVVFVAGTFMTVMTAVRMPLALQRWVYVVSIIAHTAVGVSAYGAAFTLVGVIVCVSVIITEMVVYWVLERCHARVWPYPLSPLEVTSLCFSILFIRFF